MSFALRRYSGQAPEWGQSSERPSHEKLGIFSPTFYYPVRGEGLEMELTLKYSYIWNLHKNPQSIGIRELPGYWGGGVCQGNHEAPTTLLITLICSIWSSFVYPLLYSFIIIIDNRKTVYLSSESGFCKLIELRCRSWELPPISENHNWQLEIAIGIWV